MRLAAVLSVGVVIGLVPQVPALAAKPWSPGGPSRASVAVGSQKPKAPAMAQSDTAAVTSIPNRTFPKGGAARVATSGARTSVGGMAVTLTARSAVSQVPLSRGPMVPSVDTAPAPGAPLAATLQVQVQPQAVATSLGVRGVVLTVARTDAETATAEVQASFDYSTFANAYGASFGQRLQLVQLPACAVTTPAVPACQEQKAVASRNASGQVTGELRVPAASGARTATADAAGTDVMVVALASGATSQGQTFTATDLSQAYSWTAGSQGGSFSTSYPLKTPASLGGPAPDLALQYDSGGVDSMTVAQNGQTSWVGEGWDLQTGYIEQSFRSCNQDGGTTGDLCQFSPYNATMVFHGSSAQLVRDATTGVWHAQDDSAIKIDQVTGTGAANAPGTNGDTLNRYWRVITQDGTQYFFGINYRYTGDTAQTLSTQTEPVFGNNSGETCYNATFASAWCQVAYRWNLDYVVDAAGNSMTYSYFPYQGNVGLNNNTIIKPYIIHDTLDTITYGTRAGSEATTTAPMKVVFGRANRCINTCQPNTTDYPDTPFDLLCTSGTSCPSTKTPVYWTRYQLASVTTLVYTGGAYRNVDAWNMVYTFPSTGDHILPAGDDTSPNLWLYKITHTGYAADGVTTLAEPTVIMGGNAYANRVNWGDSIGVAPYEHYRLTVIKNGMGGQTVIGYSGVPCQPADVPTGKDASQNTLLCFPQWISVDPKANGWDWFNKYTVATVTNQDLTGGSPDEVFSYAYSTAGSDNPVLWHMDSNETTQLINRTWSQFNGFSTVTVTHGAAGGPQTVTKSLYYRGMHQDATYNQTTQTTDWRTRVVHLLASAGTPGVTAPLEGIANKCLDLTGQGTTNGTKAQLWSCTGNANQVWQAYSDGTIRNPISGRCLDVTGDAVTNGALIQLYDCSTATGEQWRPQSDGSLLNPASGKCLADQSAATTNGNPIILWTCDGTVSQKWYSQLNDADGMQGRLAEQTSWDGSQVITDQIHNYTLVNTAQRLSPAPLGTDIWAHMITDTSDHTRTWLPVTSTWRWTETDTTYTTYANPTLVKNLGDLAVATDDTCTTTDYVNADTTKWLINFPSQQVTTDCAGTPGDADYLSGSQTFYDGSATNGATPTKGQATKTTALATVVSGTKTWNQASRTGYDTTYGRVVDTWDALDHNTHTAYTPATGGPVTATTVTNPMGWITTSTIEPGHGSVTSVVDVNGKTTSVQYDALGRTTKVWQNNQATNLTPDLQFTYNVSNTAPNWVKTQKLGPTGAQVATYSIYDGQARLRQTQTPTPVANGGRMISDTAYDSRGLTAKTSTFYNNASGPSGTLATFTDSAVPTQDRFTYDNLERQTADAFYSLGTQKWTTTTSYQQDRTTITPPTGAMPSTEVFDAAGNTTGLRQYLTTNVAGAYQATTYYHDRLNQLTKTVDSLGNTWTSTYDLRGRVTASSDPDFGAVTNTYDDAGQLLTTADARPVTLAYAYDNLGRRTDTYLTSVGGTHLDTWVYDTLAKGQLTSSSEFHSGNAYTSTITGYDDAYRPLGTTITLPAAEGSALAVAAGWTTSTTYNVDGSVASTTYPAASGMAAETVTNTYDTNGFQLGATSPLDTYLSGAVYQNWGALNQTTLGTGTKRVQVTTDQYLDTHRTKTISVGTEHPGTPGTYDEQLTQNYNWSNAGTITSIDSQHAAVTTDSQCYNYDYLNRLTTAFTTTPALGGCAATPSTSTVGGPAAYWQTYSYDNSGNRTSLVSHGLGGAGDTTSTYTYPTAGTAKAHTLSSVSTVGPGGTVNNSYDYGGIGQMTTMTINGLATDFAQDNQGRLASATVHTTGASIATYLYTADGTEILRDTPTAKTLYLGGQDITTDATGTTITGVTRYYTACGTTVASRVQNGTLSWLASDHQGTAQIAVDQTTEAVSIRRQDPFGNPRGTVPNWPNPRGFVGGTTEPTGLVRLGARMYDPSTGRFTSDDSVTDIDDPQQLEGYAYASNSPVTYSDPTGRHFDPIPNTTVVVHTPGRGCARDPDDCADTKPPGMGLGCKRSDKCVLTLQQLKWKKVADDTLAKYGSSRRFICFHDHCAYTADKSLGPYTLAECHKIGASKCYAAKSARDFATDAANSAFPQDDTEAKRSADPYYNALHHALWITDMLSDGLTPREVMEIAVAHELDGGGGKHGFGSIDSNIDMANNESAIAIYQKYTVDPDAPIAELWRIISNATKPGGSGEVLGIALHFESRG
jgi:RHS repeat-associated protein